MRKGRGEGLLEHVEGPSEHLPEAEFSSIPEVTLYFWVIKILCTTVGETAADFLNDNLGLGLTNTTWVMSAVLAVALVFQFRLRRYVPAAYWLAVVLISVVGTLITDNLTDNFGVSLVDDDDRLQHRARRDVRRLVREREDALDPHHLHDQARGLLLARDPVHVRPRHGGGRPDRRAARLGYWQSALLFGGADRRRLRRRTCASR